MLAGIGLDLRRRLPAGLACPAPLAFGTDEPEDLLRQAALFFAETGVRGLQGFGAGLEAGERVALDPALRAQLYPFCRLSGPANVLVVPARHSASISVKLMQEMAGATVIGPILSGVDKPIQICSTGSTVNDIVNMAVIAACRLGQ